MIKPGAGVVIGKEDVYECVVRMGVGAAEEKSAVVGEGDGQRQKNNRVIPIEKRAHTRSAIAKVRRLQLNAISQHTHLMLPQGKRLLEAIQRDALWAVHAAHSASRCILFFNLLRLSLRLLNKLRRYLRSKYRNCA